MDHWTRRALGMLTIGGAGAGAILSLLYVGSQGETSGRMVAGVFLALYILCMFAGVGVIEGNYRATALCCALWLLQVPVVQTPLVGYTFSSGAALQVYVFLDPVEPGVYYSIGSRFSLAWDEPGRRMQLGLNVVAIVVGALLWRSARRLRGARRVD